MEDSKAQELAISIYVITILLLIVIQGKNLQFTNLFALLALVAITLVFPLIGLILAVPVVLIMYIQHYQVIKKRIAEIKETNISFGNS